MSRGASATPRPGGQPAPQRSALVTGASSGIGWATAQTFARAGYDLAVTARREDRLHALAAECSGHGIRVCVLPGDLADAAFAAGLCDRAEAALGRLDVLVNNAAQPLHKQLYRTTLADAARVMQVNFMAAVATTLSAIPIMLRAGGGTIVNVSSIAAKVVPTHEALYAASKAALNAFSDGLVNDLHGSGIRVGLVHPGPIETEIWSKLEEPGFYSGRLYPAESVADAVLEVVRGGAQEIYVPRRSPALATARWLRILWPGLLRRGLRAHDPVTPEMLEAARARARAAHRTT